METKELNLNEMVLLRGLLFDSRIKQNLDIDELKIQAAQTDSISYLSKVKEIIKGKENMLIMINDLMEKID